MSTALTDSQRNQIIETIHRGAKIEAIKLYMDATGIGLKEAKDAVEAMEAGLEPRPAGTNDPFAKKSGCFGMIAVLITTIMTVAVVVALN
jgi:hypothetical protein